MHKAGFVNIIGSPNVGKSTLMNVLIGEKLSIITSKAQTTRHRVMGIVNGDDFQIVYSDTPGIIKPAYKLQESMMKFTQSAFTDADILLFVTDVFENPETHASVEKLRQLDIPLILVLNKIDLLKEQSPEEKMSGWNAVLPKAEVIPVSALLNFNVSRLFDRIIELLPQGEPYYPKDTLTDRNVRFFVSEIIREKIFLNFKKEIPYSCEVEIEEYTESEKIDHIKALIHVSKDTHKGILIGKKGSALKKVGTEAREDIEKFLDKKVFMEMYVKVSKDWKDKHTMLKNFGYNS